MLRATTSRAAVFIGKRTHENPNQKQSKQPQVGIVFDSKTPYTHLFFTPLAANESPEVHQFRVHFGFLSHESGGGGGGGLWGNKVQQPHTGLLEVIAVRGLLSLDVAVWIVFDCACSNDNVYASESVYPPRLIDIRAIKAQFRQRILVD
jgi:hypothetical protein